MAGVLITNSLKLYPPPCLRHAWRVVLTAVLEFLCSFPSQQFRNSFWISILRLEILPEFESVRESDRFRKGLTESQFFQRSRNPGNLKMQPLSSDISVLSQNVNKRKRGSHVPRKVTPPLSSLTAGYTFLRESRAGPKTCRFSEVCH